MVQTSVLQEIEAADLVVLNVWVPMYPGDAEGRARQATALLPDPRVRHFWIDGKELGEAFQKALDLPRVAWDIYFVYAPGVRWEDAPPVPTFFMHQLHGMPEESLLDGAVLADRIRRVLVG